MLFYRQLCTDTSAGRQVGKIYKNFVFMEILQFCYVISKGEDCPSLYEISIGFWSCSSRVVYFFLHFITSVRSISSRQIRHYSINTT